MFSGDGWSHKSLVNFELSPLVQHFDARPIFKWRYCAFCVMHSCEVYTVWLKYLTTYLTYGKKSLYSPKNCLFWPLGLYFQSKAEKISGRYANFWSLKSFCLWNLAKKNSSEDADFFDNFPYKHKFWTAWVNREFTRICHKTAWFTSLCSKFMIYFLESIFYSLPNTLLCSPIFIPRDSYICKTLLQSIIRST